MREMLDHESGKYPVAHSRDCFLRMVKEITKKHDSDKQEQPKLKEDHQSACQQGDFTVTRALGGQKALDNKLVHAVTCRVQECPAQDSGPKCVRNPKVGREIKECEFVTCIGQDSLPAGRN